MKIYQILVVLMALSGLFVNMAAGAQYNSSGYDNNTLTTMKVFADMNTVKVVMNTDSTYLSVKINQSKVMQKSSNESIGYQGLLQSGPLQFGDDFKIGKGFNAEKKAIVRLPGTYNPMIDTYMVVTAYLQTIDGKAGIMQVVVHIPPQNNSGV